MKRLIKTTVGSLALMLCTMSVNAANYALVSPNESLKIDISTDNGLEYSFEAYGEKMISSSPIGLVVLESGLWNGRGEKPVEKRGVESETIETIMYRCDDFDVTYNELDLRFKEFGVIFRAYDEGVAYRIYTRNKKPITIMNEIAKFNIVGDQECYIPYVRWNDEKRFYTSFENTYVVAPLSDARTGWLGFTPISIKFTGERKLSIMESDLENYPGMFLEPQLNHFKGVFASYPKTMSVIPYRKQELVETREDYIAKLDKAQLLPWRIMSVTKRDIDMPTNNMIYALASPCRIEDTSWIKGGKSIWDWWNSWGETKVDFKAGINMETYRHYIDFAAKNNIEYITMDEGWYKQGTGDMFQPNNGIDVEELVRYADERNVGIFLWSVFNVTYAQREEAFEYYSKIGVKGFKVDFLDRDDQQAVRQAYELTECAAKYKLMLDYHGFFKPTGLNRTYPNVINYEAVYGQEQLKWRSIKTDLPLYHTTFPYIRMMAGPVDMTPGAMRNATKKEYGPNVYNPMSQGTRAYQVALYVVYDQPFTMLCDNTTAYADNQETTDFLSEIPITNILETKVLQGHIGEYIVSARRFKDCWYVGGITNWTSREIELDLSFLEKGEYDIELYRDGINVDKCATDYKIDYLVKSSSDKISISMSEAGGFVARITKK